jgi:hypothetical protein
MRVIPFLFAVLLICLSLFRQDFFVRHSTIFPLYFCLFPIGMLILLWSVSNKRRMRFAALLSVCAAIEVGLVGSVIYMARYQRYQPLPEDYYYWVLGQYGYFKNTTNFNKDLSLYDSSLVYRFQPNITRRFKNAEFDVEVKSNSLGLRDDEASLRHPSIVVMGDSHGMGWGVEKKERFSEAIEQRLDVNVLNTAITSYGTYRETKSLAQVDLDSCKLLIIQYCENDLEENKANLPEPKKSLTDQYGFEIAAKQNTINNTYYPFKGLFVGIRWLITTGANSAFQAIPTATAKNAASAHSVVKSAHAEAFFPYLSRIRTRYKGPILVFDLGVYNYPIVTEFQAYQASHPADDLHFVNVHPLLSRKDYFTIDDHINAHGHAKIGAALADYIQKRGWVE